MSHSAAGDVVDNDRASAGEDERERPEEFGNQFLSRAKHIRQSACNVRLAVIYVKAYTLDVKLYTAFFAALADPSRLRLLHLMKEGEICVCFLQGTLRTNQPKISRHLAYLRRAGLVEARRDGKWMHYRLKKLATPLQRVLNEVFKATSDERQMQNDAQRAQQIQCAPRRYGLNSPEDTEPRSSSRDQDCC